MKKTEPEDKSQKCGAPYRGRDPPHGMEKEHMDRKQDEVTISFPEALTVQGFPGCVLNSVCSFTPRAENAEISVTQEKIERRYAND